MPPVVFNPYSYDIHEDPFPTYQQLRTHAPVYRNEALGFWALSRYDDVLAAFKDPLTFSNAQGVSLEARVALEAIHGRLPDYEIDATKLVRVHSPNVRGVASMPITFTPRS